jgi:superfamily II DNA/RNA helicase
MCQHLSSHSQLLAVLAENNVRIAAACVSISPQLQQEGDLDLTHVRHFILDECDKMLEQNGECRDAYALVYPHRISRK